MPKQIPPEELASIEAVIATHPEGLSLQAIAEALGDAIPRRTLQYRLKHLIEKGRLIAEGKRRWAKYRLAHDAKAQAEAGKTIEPAATAAIPLSKAGREIQSYVCRPLTARKIVGYERGFLDAYVPNTSAYLSDEDRARLRSPGVPVASAQPAGTYARQILNRLLIDLSWNSSRLEGNTYSLLDTKRLIDFGEAAQGKDQIEAQMILNHKDAIEFLVGSAEEIGFNRHTILNLHALLANNLLADPGATGRIRHISVAIEKSAFHPLEGPQRIEECFDRILATAAAIDDPFEQSFFVMAHLPYLQPFDDVNKRVSRLAANIPLIKANLIPLAFTDVPTDLYTQAILGVYELNKIELLRDVYFWAYQRSSERYAAVRQSLGEPDPFRLRHRDALRTVIQEIVRNRMGRKASFAFISAWAADRLQKDDQDRFREIAESEILGLHEGNYARYQLKPSEFSDWREAWTAGR